MPESFELPIFTKIYQFYQEIYKLRLTVPKQDRYALWQKVDNLTIEIMEEILLVTGGQKEDKSSLLLKTSNQLNLLRIFIRLAKDVKAIDTKKYISLQEKLDEIGRMLGGWIKSTKTP